MRFLIISNNEVIHEFNAADLPAARVLAVAFVRQRRISVRLAGVLRNIDVTTPEPPPPTIDDQPAEP